MKTDREKAMEWWNSMAFEERFYKTIKNNEWIEGDHTRHPDSLTGREIEIIWRQEIQQNPIHQQIIDDCGGEEKFCELEGVLKHYEPQHLYILSYEKPKKGDWCLDLDTNNIFKLGKWGTNNAKKIIATTDTSLGLLLIPKSFIEYYISEYNKRNIITHVEVEYEDNGEEGWIGDNYNGEPFWNEKLELKVNPDNTINIYPIKNSWNREEFEIAIRETWRVACSDTYKALSPELEDEWVNEILK